MWDSFPGIDRQTPVWQQREWTSYRIEGDRPADQCDTQHGGLRVDRLLIAGVDSVVGANLAVLWGGRRPVTGLCWQHPLAIEGCEVEGPTSPLQPAAARMLASQPDWVVFCGPGSVSSWNEQRPDWSSCDWPRAAAEWAEAAREWGAEFTLISSDAVFTGPWMFHRETGACFCDSAEARLLRQTEQAVLTANPQALVVRTNAFGWAPLPELAGLPEQIVDTLTNDGHLRLDCQRHATPILVTDLAGVLEEAHVKKLAGIHHIGGGERVNPFRFACLLADQFGLPLAGLNAHDLGANGRREFGGGETSLQSRRIRKTLNVPLPLIREAVAQLHDQHVSGYRDRFQSESFTLVPARAA
jgi:dTDP-4-dehydrorhamnose reductase